MLKKKFLLIYFILISALGINSKAAKIPMEQYLNIRSAINPIFSYNDEYIIFLTNITGANQAWKIKSNGGWPNQLTYFKNEVRFISASSANDRIIFGMDKNGNEHTQLFITDINGSATERITNYLDSTYIFGAWSKDGKMIAFSSNERDKTSFDVYIKEIGSGETKMVYKSNSTFFVEDCSNDNKYIILKELINISDSNLYLLDWQKGKAELLTAHTGNVKYENAKFSYDDAKIWLLTNKDNNFMQLATLNLSTKELEFFKLIPYDYEEFTLSKDGKYLAYTINIDGFSHLIITDLKTNKTWGFEGFQGLIYNLAFSNKGDKLAFVYSSPKNNPDVWIFDFNKLEANQITFSDKAGISQESFVEPQIIRYKSFDNLEIPALLYLPKNKQKFSVIIMVHNGPESQARPAFNSFYQYLLNKGFAIFEPNYRDSLGYGKVFSSLDNKYKRLDAVKDIAKAAEWLKKQKEFEINKIAVMGESYGGFITLSSLALYPELFDAGIVLFGISDFIESQKKIAPYRQKWLLPEYGDSSKDKNLLKKISPVNYAHKISSPLLIIHNKNDIIVPFTKTFQIINKIKKNKGKVDLLIISDEGHAILKLDNKIKAYKAIIAFLDNHIGKER